MFTKYVFFFVCFVIILLLQILLFVVILILCVCSFCFLVCVLLWNVKAATCSLTFRMIVSCVSVEIFAHCSWNLLGLGEFCIKRKENFVSFQ